MGIHYILSKSKICHQINKITLEFSEWISWLEIKIFTLFPDYQLNVVDIHKIIHYFIHQLTLVVWACVPTNFFDTIEYFPKIACPTLTRAMHSRKRIAETFPTLPQFHWPIISVTFLFFLNKISPCFPVLSNIY